MSPVYHPCDSKTSLTTLLPRESVLEAFMGPQLLAFTFLKGVVSSWGVGLVRPQTTGCNSVSSDLVQYKPSLYAYMNVPHLGLRYCWLVNTTTACSVLDAAVYQERSGYLDGQAPFWGHHSLLERVCVYCALIMGEAVCNQGDGCHGVLPLKELGLGY